MYSLLYVSTRRMTPDVESRDVEDIVAVSRPRNRSLGITGALVATPTHFAQILEGSMDAIDEVMASIGRDHRHYGILAAPPAQKARREFHRWSLAYHGESTYVSGLFAGVLSSPTFELNAHADDIRNLMAMLA
jgi:hypothetical protein